MAQEHNSLSAIRRTLIHEPTLHSWSAVPNLLKTTPGSQENLKFTWQNIFQDSSLFIIIIARLNLIFDAHITISTSLAENTFFTLLGWASSDEKSIIFTLLSDRYLLALPCRHFIDVPFNKTHNYMISQRVIKLLYDLYGLYNRKKPSISFSRKRKSRTKNQDYHPTARTRIPRDYLRSFLQSNF